MIYIGCHLSVTDGYEAMGKTMSRFGGNTFAWFTRNPRGGKTKPVIPADAQALLSHLAKEGFGPLVAHGSYTMNLCSANKDTRANGWEMLAKDLGLEAMKRIALHPALARLPFILETPNDDEGYIEEIHTVQSWMKEMG